MKGFEFLESRSEREERESLERMHVEFARVEKIRSRQRAGENLKLYTNYLGHLRVQGEEDPDVTFIRQNDDSIWFPEQGWKSTLFECVYENRYLGVHYDVFEDLQNKIDRAKQERSV